MAGKIQIQFVPIELCDFNEGQIPDVPANPRTRTDERQELLQKSIEELPEMTTARAALCYPLNGRYVIIGGNRRLEAQRALGVEKIPVIAFPKDTPPHKLRRIAMLDNESTGATDWDKVAMEWDKSELKEWGVELPSNWAISPDDFGEEFSLPSGNKPLFSQMTFTLASPQAEQLKEAIAKAKKESDYATLDNYGNFNSNGNAIYLIVKQWAEQKK